MIRQMIDIETMAQHPHALIICIAMCRFDSDTGRIFDLQQINIDYKDCIKRYPDFIIDKSTVEFWSKQPKEILEDMQHDQVSIEDALDLLYKWSVPNQELWVWGLSYDIPVIELAIRSTKRHELYDNKMPWKYQNQRCARTVAKFFDIEIERSEGHHNALNDVIDQSKMILKILNPELDIIVDK